MFIRYFIIELNISKKNKYEFKKKKRSISSSKYSPCIQTRVTAVEPSGVLNLTNGPYKMGYVESNHRPRLSGVRSNHLSYAPKTIIKFGKKNEMFKAGDENRTRDKQRKAVVLPLNYTRLNGSAGVEPLP